jgi:outer membrane receptor protein involved in Fe transport
MKKNCLFFTFLLYSGISYALADSLPEIVVTADLRERNELDTASSVSVVTEQVITARAAQHIEDLLHTIPNVNYTSGSNRSRFFQIRGIGERSQFVGPLNPSVGFLVDNVDFSGAGTIATLMDVEQVEVLRGPQGTRYGANALAGLINVKTNDPADYFGAKLKLSAAEFNTQTFGAMLTGPLGDSVQARLVAESHESDGYYENDFLGKDDTNGRDELTIRAKVHVDVSDTWNLDMSLSKVDVDNGYDAFTLDNTRDTLSDEPGHDRQDSTSFAIDSTWNLSLFDVRAIASVADSDIEYGFDEDWTYTGIHPWGYTSTDNYIRERDTRSLEVRLVSNEDGLIFGGSTSWVVGFYSLFSEESLTREYTYLPENFTSDYDFDTYAVFFQVDSSLSGKLELSTGLRLEKRDTEYANSDGVAFKPDEDLWGGRIALKYFLSEDTMSYGSVARGYKAGGFNTDGSLDVALREFNEEYLIEYELGIKSKLMDNQLHLRAAVFYDDRHDQQVKSSMVIGRPDGTTEFIDFIGNAADGTNKGLEVELNWYATDALKIVASAGLLDAEFDNYINEFGEDLSGRDQAQAPAWMYHLAADYQFDNWYIQLSVDGKDEYYFSDRHAVQSDSYVLLNANAGYETDKWKISIWGRNLSDEDYATRAFGSFGNDPRKFYVTEPYFQFGEPRIVGLTFEMNLGD